MTITSLVENTSREDFPIEHGLSLHIRLEDGRQILFDMGQGNLFARNAEHLDIRLSEVDMAIVSHGHYDHGGGIGTFLELNLHAPVYLNEHAFEPHYSLRDKGVAYIGLDPKLKGNGRLIICKEVVSIGHGIILFANVTGDCLCPTGNRLLFGPTPDTNDNFCHEQSLLIEENGKTVLFAGCAHAGIVNIMQKAIRLTGHSLTHVFAGMHLVKSGLPEAEETAFIHALADKLLEYPGCRYYTMHCTGLPQYQILADRMKDSISYLSCGESVTI